MDLERAVAETEAAFEAACIALKEARRRFDRSRSAKNRTAWLAADKEFDRACEASREAQDALRRAERRAEAEVIWAARRAKAARQGSLLFA